jgi:hypothetical protein
MAKVKKTITNKQVDKKQVELGELALREFLLTRPDELVDKAGLDESLDELLLKTALVNPTQHPHIIGARVAYISKFPMEFYRQIFKLYGWPVVSDECLLKRPGIVAKITAYLIYMRFPKGVLKELQKLNRKNGDGIRLFKHFQWLTPEGEKLLLQYIKEATDLMAEHHNWNPFIKDFTLKYSNPYNLSWDNY